MGVVGVLTEGANSLVGLFGGYPLLGWFFKRESKKENAHDWESKAKPSILEVP